MGTGQASHLVNVIDFGLAKKFRDRDGDHIPYKQDAHHGVGTSLFASINTHHGIGRFCLSPCFRIGHTYANLSEASPRDDLESLSYMLVYFLRGTLPWRKLKAATIAGKLPGISFVTPSFLLARHCMPVYPANLQCCMSMPEFGDTPDYMGLRATLREL